MSVQSAQTYLPPWARRVAEQRDVALAVLLGALGELELFGHEKYNGKPVWPGPVWVNAILIVALTAPFAWRRRRPLTAVLVIFAVMTVSTLILGGPESATIFIVLIAATFSGAAYSRRLWPVIAAGLVASLAHGLNDPSSEGLADLTWTYGLVAISALIGRAVWFRQHRIGALETDAATAEERHARQIEEATAAERASIARELHDVVSHAVSVIVIQSQVGARALPDDLTGDLRVVADSLAAIESSARNAMTELRQLLTLLTTDPGPASTTPAASLRQVGELIDQCRAAGLEVDADVDPDLGALPPLADLAAYRVLQEALTNTLRHAPGARARVRVHRRSDVLELLAEDDGAPALPSSPGAQTGTGRGLIGMRERLSLAGGRLVVAGPEGTGFRVHALVPLPVREQPAENAS